MRVESGVQTAKKKFPNHERRHICRHFVQPINDHDWCYSMYVASNLYLKLSNISIIRSLKTNTQC